MGRNTMLFLILSIFFYYDLLHCGQGKANGKDEFMDYSITEFWWNSTPGIDQTHRITPQYSFLTTPFGWIPNANYSPDFPLDDEPPTTIEELEKFYPFPNITRPSFPFDIKNYTVATPPRSAPWHIQYPGLTPPPNFPSNYRYPTIYQSSLPSAYRPSPTGPTPRGPSITLPEVERPEFPYPTDPILLSEEWMDSEEHEKTRRVSPFAAAERSGTTAKVVPMINPVFNYDYTTDGLPEAFRWFSKRTQDASSKLKNSVFEDPPRAVLREEIPALERKARDSEFKDEASLYDPYEESATQKDTKHTDTLTTATIQSPKTHFLSVSMAQSSSDYDIKKTTTLKNKTSFLRVMAMLDRPVTMLKEEWGQSDQVTTTPTAVKESLRQISVTQSYFEMIEALKEGYMMVFLIELTRLIATKERKAVRDVVKHTDQIIYGFYQSGQLRWLGKSLIDVTTKVARLLKELQIDVIQNHAANWYHMLSQRHQVLSVEVNTILEYADMLYDDEEGRLLFDALKEFAAYPNIALTGYWLCNSLIHNFLRPFRRLKDTPERQELLDLVNLSLKTRSSSIGFNEEPQLRDGDVKQDDSPPNDKKLSTKKEKSPRERKRKRHHRSHKKEREGIRYTDIDLT